MRAWTNIAACIGLVQVTVYMNSSYLCAMSAVLTTSSIIKDQSIYYYIYMYAFSRRFYPKRLTVHSSYTFVLSVCVFPGNRTHNLCAANAMLYHWATETLLYYWRCGELLIIVVITHAYDCVGCVGVCVCVCACVCVCVFIQTEMSSARPVYLITAWFLGNQPARVVEDCSVCACADARREKSPRALYIPRAAASSVQ